MRKNKGITLTTTGFILLALGIAMILTGIFLLVNQMDTEPEIKDVYSQIASDLEVISEEIKSEPSEVKVIELETLTEESSEIIKEIPSKDIEEESSYEYIEEEPVIIIEEPVVEQEEVETEPEPSVDYVPVVVTETNEPDIEASSEDSESSDTETIATSVADYYWDGPILTATKGVNWGPSGKETYYNLPMDGIIEIMRVYCNNYDEHWIREDGCHMLGDYIMVAADLSIRPRGSLVPTSLGMGIVCDTGGFIYIDAYQLDIAVVW